MMRRVANFIKAYWRVLIALIKRQPVRVSDADWLLRSWCCFDCEHRRVRMCGMCKCPLSRKLPLATERCPAGKWERYQFVAKPKSSKCNGC